MDKMEIYGINVILIVIVVIVNKKDLKHLRIF